MMDSKSSFGGVVSSTTSSDIMTEGQAKPATQPLSLNSAQTGNAKCNSQSIILSILTGKTAETNLASSNSISGEVSSSTNLSDRLKESVATTNFVLLKPTAMSVSLREDFVTPSTQKKADTIGSSVLAKIKDIAASVMPLPVQIKGNNPLTYQQEGELWSAFRENMYLGKKRHHELATKMGVHSSVIHGFFRQNRLALFKRLRRERKGEVVKQIKQAQEDLIKMEEFPKVVKIPDFRCEKTQKRKLQADKETSTESRKQLSAEAQIIKLQRSSTVVKSVCLTNKKTKKGNEQPQKDRKLEGKKEQRKRVQVVKSDKSSETVTSLCLKNKKTLKQKQQPKTDAHPKGKTQRKRSVSGRQPSKKSSNVAKSLLIVHKKTEAQKQQPGKSTPPKSKKQQGKDVSSGGKLKKPRRSSRVAESLALAYKKTQEQKQQPDRNTAPKRKKQQRKLSSREQLIKPKKSPRVTKSSQTVREKTQNQRQHSNNEIPSEIEDELLSTGVQPEGIQPTVQDQASLQMGETQIAQFPYSSFDNYSAYHILRGLTTWSPAADYQDMDQISYPTVSTVLPTHDQVFPGSSGPPGQGEGDFSEEGTMMPIYAPLVEASPMTCSTWFPSTSTPPSREFSDLLSPTWVTEPPVLAPNMEYYDYGACEAEEHPLPRQKKKKPANKKTPPKSKAQQAASLPPGVQLKDSKRSSRVVKSQPTCKKAQKQKRQPNRKPESKSKAALSSTDVQVKKSKMFSGVVKSSCPRPKKKTQKQRQDPKKRNASESKVQKGVEPAVLYQPPEAANFQIGETQSAQFPYGSFDNFPEYEYPPGLTPWSPGYQVKEQTSHLSQCTELPIHDQVFPMSSGLLGMGVGNFSGPETMKPVHAPLTCSSWLPPTPTPTSHGFLDLLLNPSLNSVPAVPPVLPPIWEDYGRYD